MISDATAFLDVTVSEPPLLTSPSILIETSAGDIRLSCTGNIAALKGRWENLQQVAPCSYAQTFSCAQAWSTHVIAARGEAPVIVVGTAANGATLFIWPFEPHRYMGQNVLRWLGQEHSNYNMGLFAPDYARRLTEADMRILLDQAARAVCVSAFLLERQPAAWDGVSNPFALLTTQPNPNTGHAVTLGPDFEALYNARFSARSRSGLKRKERKLSESGAVSYGWAEDGEERTGLLDVFFTQRSGRFAELGQNDAFADDCYRGFYRALAALPNSDPARLHVGYIKIGDAVAATFSGMLHQGRFVVIFSSLTDDEELRKSSPGALLIQHQIADLCARGQSLYDMGAGNGRHKSDWCDVEQALFDCMLPAGVAGALVTLPAALKGHIKRVVKNDPRLWSLYDGMRRRLYGRRDTAA